MRAAGRAMQRRRAKDSREAGVRPYTQESLLIDAVPEMAGRRLVCTSAGLAQLAVKAARAWPDTAVVCWYLDLYRARLAKDHWGELPQNLQIDCAADLADGEADVVAFPFSPGGEAELTREVIQAGHQNLRIDGRMFAAIENRHDSWLGEQLRRVFRKLERRDMATGVLYVGTKTEPLKKIKNYACEFAFRDRGRLIRACSRPGVFSHRHIDPGARHLINTMQIDRGMRVLDIGCGAGVVALASACRAEGVQVHAVDSNARAIECTQRGAALNGLANLTTELNADGKYAGAGQYDVALANPPYYAGFRIARHFLTAARDALRPGGRLLVVTKQPNWYDEHMIECYDDVAISECKGYYLVQGAAPTGSATQ
jgi:16S rRNA (guanine1207-N2)-methyltransferase